MNNPTDLMDEYLIEMKRKKTPEYSHFSNDGNSPVQLTWNNFAFNKDKFRHKADQRKDEKIDLVINYLNYFITVRGCTSIVVIVVLKEEMGSLVITVYISLQLHRLLIYFILDLLFILARSSCPIPFFSVGKNFEHGRHFFLQ